MESFIVLMKDGTRIEPGYRLPNNIKDAEDSRKKYVFNNGASTN